MRSPRRMLRDVRSDPRSLALDVLLRVERGAFCDVLVGETLARQGLDAREAGLFTRLVYGTETWRGRIDWTLAALVRRPLEALDAPVRTTLRLGLFQLLLLDRVPPHAAIDTSVELVKQRSGVAASKLVNAVLRTFQRRGERTFPDPAREPDAHLAVRYSHPEWLVRLWRREVGDDRLAALLAADDEPAPTVVRVDPTLLSREQALAELARRGVTARAATWARCGVIVEGPIAAVAEVSGLTLQGEASQLVADLVAAGPGERVLDLCAAPGGKAGALAERIGTGRVFAADRSRAGVRRIAALGARWPGRIAPFVCDATAPPLAAPGFDAVLVDAPCSGLGTLRAHPEIRWRRSPEDLQQLAGRQARILAAAAGLVHRGGRLVYATCTIAAAENEAVVDGFLAEHPGFRAVDARPYLPGATAPLVDARGALRTAPDRGGLDGFYAIRLERMA